MNASQSIYVGPLPAAVDAGAAEGAGGLSPFRRLLESVWSAQAGQLAALGLSLKREQAADVLQDVYLMAIAKPPAISDGGELKRWLFRVTVNRCHLEHRPRSRWRSLWRRMAAAWRGETTADASIGDRELKREVVQALAKLPDDDRALVAMRYFSDLNSREIAQIVGIPESTVRGRLRAARRKLAQELASWNDED